MSSDHRRTTGHLGRLLQAHTVDEFLHRLAPKEADPAPDFPGGARASEDVLDRRWDFLKADPAARDAVLDPQTRGHLDRYQTNVENLIGTVKVPVGVAGPLRVNGLFAQGDYYVPLATTEAALVASYDRGSRLISACGGCTAMLLNEGVSRAPGFAFHDLRECGQFLLWATDHLEDFRTVAEATTHHGKLADLRVTVEGNHVYLNFEFTTGDAAGQNMVTLATDAVCDHIRDHCPIKPQYSFVEGNLSGDKKASAQSFLLVRGKKVSAEVLVPAELVRKKLGTTPEMMVNYWRMSALGGVLSGTMGVQGHYANGLAALFLACGQDVACVAESAVGVTRFEVGDGGGLYASVTLPNIMVGTVGGGTGLPSQRACLEIMGLAGEGHAAALAEVCAAVCLAGELSIIGALCSGNFSRAHKVLARSRAAARKRQG
ncbi:MAG TPA: hydroxymethylglutaryl-CoA reductase [Gemmataceae bacterium]